MTKLLIEVLDIERKTKTGLIIPDNARVKSNMAEVIAVSDKNSIIKKGNKILFFNNNDRIIEVESKTYIEIDEACVLAIISE